MTKEDIMKKTFELAKKGLGTTWPNPLVGAVLIKDNRVIGMGYHKRSGENHAEIEALNNCQESPEGAILFVNLEPCCHTNKKTPPCAQRLIEAKIKKVVIANVDPNPEVSGKGVELLRSAGIEVDVGVLEEEGNDLNEVFFTAQKQKRPFINFKSATTLDGKTAMTNGESQWITSEASRLHAHALRAVHQGIIVGGETVRKDNPRLTVRTEDYNWPQPFRIVVTRSGNLPPESHLFTDEYKDRTLIYTQKELQFNFPSEQVIQISSLKDVMDDLFKRNLINLMLESGPNLATEFVKLGYVDRVSLYQNPSFMGSGQEILSDLDVKTLAERPKLKKVDFQWLSEDIFLTGQLVKD
jgi:diaminohydroxyphosphoribosylaminopyrimidine deaminase/5-amino-6-(5-phosphoribosylamino)uracil reductase